MPEIFIGLSVAVLGVVTAGYMQFKRSRRAPLMCPRRAPCEKVIGSSYGTTFGFSNTVLGLAYFFVVALLYISQIVFPHLMNIFSLAILVVVSFGICFSIYLITVQAVILRSWCLWCIGIAVLNAALAVLLFFLPRAGVYDILSTHRVWVIIMHNIGFILGLGATTVTDVLSIRFLSDGKVTADEKGVMDTLSKVIWVGLAILVVSGVLLYLPEQTRLLASSKFLLKIVVVSVVILNGAALNLFVAPRIGSFSFDESARGLRRLAYTLGGISIVSWYTAFFLGSFRSIPISFKHGLYGYGALLLAVIIGAQIHERLSARKHVQ